MKSRFPSSLKSATAKSITAPPGTVFDRRTPGAKPLPDPVRRRNSGDAGTGQGTAGLQAVANISVVAAHRRAGDAGAGGSAGLEAVARVAVVAYDGLSGDASQCCIASLDAVAGVAVVANDGNT